LTLLASRPAWTRQLLDAVAAGRVDVAAVPDVVVRKMHLHRDVAIRAAIEAHWGSLAGATTAEMEADIDRYREVIASGIGNPRVGKKWFATQCGTCHQLFGEGGQAGPDLTSYQRQDVRGMVAHVVNPSLEIREGFENYLVLTDDGRAINGLMADSDRQVVVIRDASGQSRTIPRDEIVEMSAVPQSLMPQGLLAPLGDQTIRDLFAYLRSPQPIP
jgi:putative heme-binding domain-containing protein